MGVEGNWAIIKGHREKLQHRDIHGLAEILFRGQEDWLGERLLLREDEALAMEFLSVLGQGGSQKAVNLLLRQLESRDEALQVAAAEALKRCPQELTMDSLVQAMLRQSGSSIKAGEILMGYGRMGRNALWQLWFGSSKPPGLKAQILQLLAEVGDERAGPLAYLAFLSEEDSLVRAALHASEKLDEKSLWGNVAGCLASPGWRLRGKAAQLLGRWREKRAWTHLFAMGVDPDPWVEEERQKAMALLSG